MKTISTATYRENRSRIPSEELTKFNGMWVAFSADGRSIVASAPTIAEVAEQVHAASQELGDVVFEHLESEMETNLGAAEFT